ncbi:60S ribosome subunit biogenesis protein NOP8 [Spathaspora sp. JA1]|nr:60S ribosome subunit biogenesis protein NOP8 [Spathaspora sp. JA1]
MSVRIHIGNISPSLHSQPDTLTTRLSKYGEIIKPLTFHTKPSQDHYFAYVTLNITSESFTKLKSQLNGMKFMGNKLSINVAKPEYNSVSNMPDHDKKERELRDRISQVRQVRIHDSHITYKETTQGELYHGSSISGGVWSVSEHTLAGASGNTKNKSGPSHRLNGKESYGAWTVAKTHNRNSSGGGEIIQGRLRNSARKDIRHQTLRILINGQLKMIKAYKTKLWGIEKRELGELSYRYESGNWINGDGDLIERVEQQGEEVEQEVEQEHVKNKSVLELIDFNKPVELDEDMPGYEHITMNEGSREAVSEVVGEELSVAPVEEYYDEDDEGNEIDFETINIQGEDVEQAEPIEDAPPVETKEDTKASATKVNATNNLDTLRSLFNPTTESTFTLQVSDDDIEETPEQTQAQQQEILEQIQLKQQQEIQTIRKSKFGLFWPHFESPFLSTQSQLNKLGDKIELPEAESDEPSEETKYEVWFWNNRGEISRQCKRRRRDVLRIMNKRSKKN